MKLFSLTLSAVLIALAAPVWSHSNETLHLYNWNDYFAEDTLAGFEAATGIRPILDVYDSNEVLEAKLFAGRSGYDLVFPTAHPFAARQVRAGMYRPLDRDALPGLAHLDPNVMARLSLSDPDNAHLVPYLWGTSGFGINVDQVRAVLGEDVDLDTWSLIFDPDMAMPLSRCGISLLDDSTEVFSAALAYLGKDPNSLDPNDLDAAEALIRSIRPAVRYFHSSQYISDLANGELCIAMGYSGDILQAQARAAEASRGVVIEYHIPREGAAFWTDVMAIPADAPNPLAAQAFIAYILEPEVIAAISNAVFYANPNLAATARLDPEVREDTSIYPPPEVMERLFVPNERTDREIRELNRRWTRIKANR